MEIKQLRVLEVKIEICRHLCYADISSSGMWQQEADVKAELLRLLEPEMLAEGAST